MPDYVTIALLEDLPPGTIRTFMNGDTHLALANVDGHVYALEDVCTHDGGPLGDGELVAHEVECPRHGARFDIRDGTARAFPAVVGIKTFAVRIQDGRVQVALDD